MDRPHWIVTVQVVFAGATCFLAGLCWLVQLVVYPSFRTVGPTGAWARFHADHSRRLAAVIAVPWAVQGASLAVLLIRRDGPVGLIVGSAVCAAAPVAVTVLSAVPLHERLSRYDSQLVTALLRVNAVRTALWTAGAVLSLLLISC